MKKQKKVELPEIGYVINVTTQVRFPTHRELFRFMREKAKLTQGQLAKKLKTKQSAIARLETHKRLPSLLTFKKIAVACGFYIEAPWFMCKKCRKNIRECTCKKT